ncbi:hypothetical protein B0H10DRAFT_1952325 [Mycena sp. CBHHK59/15]|nr:hypothetical protein B0H10DRAFT_1952325 [Mycena sp. CBHHK59/15]
MCCSSPALSHLLWLAWPGSTLPTQARFMPPMVLDPMQGPSPTVGADLRSQVALFGQLMCSGNPHKTSRQSSAGWAHPQALSTSNWTRPTLSRHAFDSPGSTCTALPQCPAPITHHLTQNSVLTCSSFTGHWSPFALGDVADRSPLGYVSMTKAVG